MTIKLKNSDKIRIINSQDVFTVMQAILKREDKIDKEKEHFWMIGLTSDNRILYIELVSLGSVKATVVEPMNIFRVAVLKGAVKVVMIHNHPSGAPRKRIGVIHKQYVNIWSNIVDRKAGIKVKTTLFLKPFLNVVKECLTILGTAIQSNTMATQETVDRCFVGWNTYLKVRVECSYRQYLTLGDMKSLRG